MLSEFEEARKKKLISDLNDLIDDSDGYFYCPSCEGFIFKLNRDLSIECAECGECVELSEE